MYLLTELNEYEMANFKYVSCIKIAGAPILPPLISDEDRKMLSVYRAKAVEKENELLKSRLEKWKSINESGDESITESSFNLESSNNSLDTANVMEFIRQALFDVENSDVKQLQAEILQAIKNNVPIRSSSSDTLHQLEDISLSEDKIPHEQYMFSPCSSNVSKEISLNKTISEKDGCDTNIYISKSSPGTPLYCQSEFKYNSNSFIESSEKMKQTSENVANDIELTPPKLIRSNSYTLDSPSPSVLVYLKSLRKYHSDASTSEISNKKRFVKNLNNIWNSYDNANHKDEINSSPPKLQTDTFSSTCPASVEFCDNEKVIENNNDSNLNIMLKSKTAISDEEDILPSSNGRTILTNNQQRDSVRIIDVISPEKEKAIILIQAGIRGYLTRRLMKTNRVMELKNTIKDSLVCALALHSEENVSRADVNLHVRLIRQVTAACYELHAIFFEYNPQEKMNLISVDREKLLSSQKAKMNLRRLKGISSDDDNPSSHSSGLIKGKQKRPYSLPLISRRNSLKKQSSK